MKILKLAGVIFISLQTLCVFSQSFDIDFPTLKGKYFGETLPGDTAILFAPDFLKSEMGFHSTIIFSSDLNEAYWSPMEKDKGVLWYSRIKNDVWSTPTRINLGIDNSNSDFRLSFDGQILYFMSFHQENSEGVEKERIWFVKKGTNEWTNPQLIDSVICEHTTHWTFSLNKNKDLYFTSEETDKKWIYLAKFNEESYERPVKLFEGSMPFVDPLDNYMLYVLKSETTKSDIFIRFKDVNGAWTEPLRMGKEINSNKHDLAPYVSPDGKFLFFISQREAMNGIMWVSTEVIGKLRGEAEFNKNK